MPRLSDVRVKRVPWLWYPYFPRGAVTIVEGSPGVGKSWVMLDIASRVSRGDIAPYPRRRLARSNCLYVTAEDDVASVVKPRVAALGGDLTRIFAEDSVRSIEAVESLVRDIGEVGLIIIDPLQAFANLYGIRYIRSVMSILGDLPGNPAVVLVRHFTKRGGQPTARGLGSIDYSAAVRSIVSIGKTVEYPDLTIMTHVKSSYAPVGPSLGFRISNGGIEWGGVVQVSAVDIGYEASTERREALAEAMDFLATVLAGGPVPAADVKREASQLGISMTTIKRARKKMGVKAKRFGESWYLIL